MTGFNKGDAVSWSWGGSRASGEVVEKFTRRVSRTIKGKKITRNGSKSRPAYLVKQEDGDRVLKLESELDRR